jgi:hypothetical protein
MPRETVLTEDDEGKRVVNALGSDVGRIVEVREGDALVDPSPSITESIVAKLGWGGQEDTETYRLEEIDVGSVTSDEIHLRL